MSRRSRPASGGPRARRRRVGSSAGTSTASRSTSATGLLWCAPGRRSAGCRAPACSCRVDDLGSGFEPGRRVGEDVDLVWRLIAAGRQVRYDPSYQAFHDSRGTWSTWLGRKAFYGTGGAWLAQRHGDWMAPAVLSPVPVLGVCALLAQRRWSVPVALAAAVAVRVRLGRSLPDTPDRPRLAGELTAEVSVSTLRQTSHLLLRHWWPGAVVAAAVSRRARRALLAAAVWDLLDHREVAPTRAAEAFVARRLRRPRLRRRPVVGGRPGSFRPRAGPARDRPPVPPLTGIASADEWWSRSGARGYVGERLWCESQWQPMLPLARRDP